VWKRTVAAAFAALALSLAGLALATPAWAHDELTGSDPSAGSTLAASPAQLVLTFSAVISTEAGATEVVMTDAAGTTLAGDPVVQDNTVTIPLVAEASGAVTVLWKVVSSDGHPISGEFGFTVDAPAPTAEPTETPTSEPTSEPSTDATSEPSPSPTVAPEGEDSTFADVWPWVVGGFLVAGVGGAVLYLLVSRARRERALEQ
jgi:methionine-rich copper-binding protein CopC